MKDSKHMQSVHNRQIRVARIAGFCFGVRRAVEIAENARRFRTGVVTMLGPIVHNTSVVNDLSKKGIATANSLDKIEKGAVIISAHGIAPNVRKMLGGQPLEVIDATCPFVTKVHRAARFLHEQGYQVVLLGDRGHKEVDGICGAVAEVGGEVTVVSGPEEAQAVKLTGKVGVVSQTTQRSADFAATVSALCERANEVRAINSICGATDELQNAAIELARQVDMVLVIGGWESANTARLRRLCEDEGVPAFQIEAATDIQESWLEGKDVIGLTGGASTPDWLIEEVARHLNGGALPEPWELKHPDECHPRPAAGLASVSGK